MARPPKLKRPARDKPPPPADAAPMTSVATGPRRAWMESGPEIDVEYGPVGRETMAAIAAELASDLDPPLSEPEAPAESPPEPAAERRVSRDTMDALTDELLREPAEPAAPPRRRRRTRGYEEEAGVPPLAPAREGLEVFEMLTFVVRGPDIGRLSSASARRIFVTERLIHRLPTRSPSDVERIDVTPWTDQGTVVVRVWCRLR
jgi:hypothetical protein